MTSALTQAVARLLLLPTLVAAVAIFVKGYAQPGDGFSAGIVASLGILLQYIAFGREKVERLMPVRGMEAAGIGGLLLALTIAIFPLFLGEPLLTHFPPPGSKVIYLGTLELITAVAFDAGIFLLVVGFAVGSMRLVARTGMNEVGGSGLPEESEEVS
ncbi:MAG: MnhB domain-containing protein [Rubrobacteraceae bacterium]